MGFFASFIFIIFLTNLYLKVTELKSEKIEFQDKYNMLIENNEPEVKIEYGTTPSYLYEYVDCLNKGISKENFSNELNTKITNLNKYMNLYSKRMQLSYKDINTGFHLGYNENHKNFAASTTKGPLALYVYLLADQNKIDLNKKYTYTKQYYADGTGIIKNSAVGTKYSVRDLTKYSIIYSDNIGYIMLRNIVKIKDVKNHFKNKGAKNLFNSPKKDGLHQLFGDLTASDGNIYMIELYKYSLNNSKNSNELVSYFRKAGLNNVKTATKKNVAHKYGWTDKYVNDMALVYDKNPYAITITSTLGDNNWSIIFQNVAKKIDVIHEMYWTETKNYCKKNLK